MNTLVKFIEDPAVQANMYNQNPLKEVGWVISAMFFVDAVMVSVVVCGCSVVVVVSVQSGECC